MNSICSSYEWHLPYVETRRRHYLSRAIVRKKKEEEEKKKRNEEESKHQEKTQDEPEEEEGEEIKDLKPEEKLKILSSKLDELHKQKHSLFIQLKQVLHYEEEKKKQEEALEKKRMEEQRLAQQQQDSQQVNQTSTQGFAPTPVSRENSFSNETSQHAYQPHQTIQMRNPRPYDKQYSGWAVHNRGRYLNYSNRGGHNRGYGYSGWSYSNLNTTRDIQPNSPVNNSPTSISPTPSPSHAPASPSSYTAPPREMTSTPPLVPRQKTEYSSYSSSYHKFSSKPYDRYYDQSRQSTPYSSRPTQGYPSSWQGDQKPRRYYGYYREYRGN